MFKFFLLILLLSCVTFSSYALAEDRSLVNNWTRWQKKPGVKINVIKDANGRDTETIVFPGNVEFTRYPDGTILSIDNSGKGAVLCTWQIYLAMQEYLEKCPFDGSQELLPRFDKAIQSINDFIVVNSLDTVTLKEIQNEAQKSKNKSFGGECNKSSFGHIVTEYKATSSEKFEKEIADFLSVPRPPVINPCM